MLKKNSPYFALNCKLCESSLHSNFKTLPCLHSFCFHCLVENFTEQLKRSACYGLPDKIFDEEEEIVVHCPDCYIDVPATLDETNTAHADATDLVNQLGAVSFLTHLLRTAKQLDLRRKCERCTPVDGSTPAAAAFCKDCEKSYCSTCLAKHNEFLAVHALLDLNVLDENRMIPVSDSSELNEGNRAIKNAKPEGSSDFPNLSTTKEGDVSSAKVSKSSITKRDSHSSHVQAEKLLRTLLEPSVKSELDAELLDEDQRLHPTFDEPSSSSVERVYNFNSASVSSSNKGIKKIEQDRKKKQALRNIIVPSKCPIHEMSFIAYCSTCDLCLCQLCWEQHSTKSEGCTNIVPLKTVAGEKRNHGFALLAEARKLIQLLNTNYLESLKKVQIWTEKCFDENEADYNGLDIDTIEAFQYHYFRQNQLHCRQLFCFMTFLRDVVHLVPDADLTICFRSIADFWQNLSSRITKKTPIPEIEPERSNFQKLYGKLETVSVTVEHKSQDYSKIKSFQMSRASVITAQSRVIDTSTCPVVSPSVVASTYFTLKEMDYISAIGVSADLHILLCIYYQCCIRIYNSKGKFITTVQIPGEPSDICVFKGSLFLLTLPLRKKIVILQSRMKPGRTRTFFVHKVVDVQKNYVSISTSLSSFIVCDVYKNVDMITVNGTVQYSILKQREQNKPGAHRLSPGPFKSTFLLFDYIHQTISCYNQTKCTLQFCIDTTTENSDSNGTSDICLGKSGRIYISDCHSIYSMDATNDPQLLWTFEEELTEEACIAFTPETNHLVVSCFAGMDKSLLILNISHP